MMNSIYLLLSQCFIFFTYKMKEIIKQSTITETIDGNEFTVIISKGEDGYYWLLRMWTKVPGDYKSIKNYFTNLFSKLTVETVKAKPTKTKSLRTDKGKTHNYPETRKKAKTLRGRPKGKPRGPRKPKLQKADEIKTDGFLKKYFKK